MLSLTGDIIDKIDQIATISYSFRETVFNTYQLTARAIGYDIPGVLVECGVGAGAQVAAMQLANTEYRQILAYDSFEGIPLAGVYDEQQPGIGQINHDVHAPVTERLISSGITSHSVNNVKDNITDLGFSLKNIQFIKGWFQNTLPLNKIEDIALLRLDGDLYESTLVCLEYLYPKVSHGGYVIIDDYALKGARKAVDKYFSDNNIKVKLTKLEPEQNGVVWFEKP